MNPSPFPNSKEGRKRSELLREALQRYADEQEWKKIYHKNILSPAEFLKLLFL
jgi:metal-responsive CopG/Arc/MetJ family transcriptional regulator